MLLGLAALSGSAQQFTAEMAFKQAAEQYIAGNNSAARQAVEQGLRFYPQDEDLNELKAKLDEQSPPEQNKQSGPGQDQPQDQSSPPDSGASQDGKQQPQSGKDSQEQKSKSQSGKQPGQEEEGEGDRPESSPGQPSEQESETQETSLGEAAGDEEQEGEENNPAQFSEERLKELNLSPQKARMILEAMRSNEIQYLQQQRRRGRRSSSGKPDW